ncbi:MAG: acetyl-CoA carboxylase biotin carboxyl carrier protein subunit [Acidimicrobiales bacterium]
MIVTSEMAAQVWRVLVEVGDEVTVGDRLLILESMKMEIDVVAPVAGRVGRIEVEPEQTVDDGDVLVELV